MGDGGRLHKGDGDGRTVRVADVGVVGLGDMYTHLTEDQEGGKNQEGEGEGRKKRGKGSGGIKKGGKGSIGGNQEGKRIQGGN